MDGIVEKFVQHPSEELLEQCTKEQLIKIAQHFSVEVEPKRIKDNLKSIIKANLQECGVLMDESGNKLQYLQHVPKEFSSLGNPMLPCTIIPIRKTVWKPGPKRSPERLGNYSFSFSSNFCRSKYIIGDNRHDWLWATYTPNDRHS
ncbi:hypothetical protein GBF38_011412 [Nibea albiflora]|uniref:Uncharacterized protein n=1 Tax=Nibea albiflora TaxID=240163 RepID=A0ACB7F3N5_NIBAL|nr:hypothetical protein GBF38_011412 [Nibea albiflora]